MDGQQENIRKPNKNSARNVQQNLVLSTTYPLNASHTKKLHVGLQLTKGATFEPLVKLTGNYAEGINLDQVAWRQFRERIPEIGAYFTESSGNRTKVNPVSFANVVVNFTSAYGAKAILVAYNENNGAASETDSEAVEQPPAAKRRKTFSVAVVMQQTTYQCLENIAPCIDARLDQLTSILEAVNECARYLIKELELSLPNDYVGIDVVRHTLRDNREDIEGAVRRQINNLSFLDNYFNILFLELISLKFRDIANMVLSNREL